MTNPSSGAVITCEEVRRTCIMCTEIGQHTRSKKILGCVKGRLEMHSKFVIQNNEIRGTSVRRVSPKLA